ALLVLAILLTSGAIGRHVMYRADLRAGLEYSAEAADTLNTGSDSPLRRQVERELERARVRDAPLEPGERIDPNTAAAEQLARLPRIGPSLAERIVSYRRAAGGFRTPDDLLGVPGIGPAVLEGIAPYLQIRTPAAVGTRNRLTGRQIDINRADAEALQTLPGVGPVIADRIVAYRRANGQFGNFSELENVTGIGPALRGRLESAGRLGP
ncbi:MAG: helix-hairpin-helix domain-containing protein, partial [Gemmatimonadota bacterium]